MSQNEYITVFVDGACRNNGHNNPLGGCGVYWGPFHPLNISEKLVGQKQTNNRAELTSAIMAGKQAQVIGMKQLEIVMDSQCVKNGIEKWIKSWKLNGWKTGRKKNTDVLNKDLWVELDQITHSNGKDIKWTWVHAHSAEPGNLEADLLAKQGISCDVCFWQQMIINPTNDNESADTQCNSTETEETELKIIVEKKEEPAKTDTCSICSGEVITAGIRCFECKNWFHYVCSELPAYQLFLFERTSRKFTCSNCTEIDVDFQIEYKKLKKPEEKNSNDRQTQTIKHFLDKNIQCSALKKDSMVQTLDLNKTTATEKTENIKDVENSFVQIIDKLIHDKSNNKDYKTDMEKLRRENAELKKKLEEIYMAAENKPNCEECIQKEKIEQKHIQEKKEWQKMLSDRQLEYDIKTYALRMESKVLNQKVKASERKLDINTSEISMYEERIHIKNSTILQLEKQISSHKLTISQLQDEVISWKLQQSRSDDRLMIEKDLGKNQKKTTITQIEENNDSMTKNRKNTSDLTSKTMQGNERTKIQKNEESIKHNGRQTFTSDQWNGNDTFKPVDKAPVKTPNATEKKSSQYNNNKKVLLIGTSNTSFIGRNCLNNQNVEVEKVLKYTIKETREYVNTLVTPAPDAIILNSLCNDVETRSPEMCVKDLAEVIDIILNKYSSTKVVVSLGNPRSKKEFNIKIEKS